MTIDIQPSARVSVRSVYFAQSVGGGPIKVGAASDVSARLGQLQTGAAAQLRILAVISRAGMACETALHRRFDHLRSHGEWFHPTRELTNFIVDLRHAPLLTGDVGCLRRVWALDATLRIRARSARRSHLLTWLGNREVPTDDGHAGAAALLAYMPNDEVTVEDAVKARAVAVATFAIEGESSR